MPSPFPGMDPYLEHSDFWAGFHQHLAIELVGQLNPNLGPKYYADINIRTVIEEINLATTQDMIPDAALLVHKLLLAPGADLARPASATLEAPIHRMLDVSQQSKLVAVLIRVTESDDLVTSIEILSPYNKRTAGGLEEYQQKRMRLLRSPVHLIELDLLRGGKRPGAELQHPPLDTDYVLLVNRNRHTQIRTSEIWPVAINEPLPILPVPLLAPDPDVTIDLRAAIDAIYERVRYGWRIDYQQPVPPPRLRPTMATWLKHQLPQVATGSQ